VSSGGGYRNLLLTIRDKTSQHIVELQFNLVSAPALATTFNTHAAVIKQCKCRHTI
jgi:hypothetical protein